MKLRNKKTGEIIELIGKLSFVKRNDDFLQSELNIFNSLAELNEEWKDYEEPKKQHWGILAMGSVIKMPDGETYELQQKEIGNYFETEEEAERAVEKLKAWKRLKDSGFRFNGGDDACISYRFDPVKWSDRLDNDFDLLFGGEE